MIWNTWTGLSCSLYFTDASRFWRRVRVYINISRHQINRTLSSTTVNPGPVTTVSSSRSTYDNAYLYILLVMLFYSFLAMTLFLCFIGSDEEAKDPYEEFINTGQPSTQKFNTAHMADKFYFEEESSLWAKVFLRRRREDTNTWGDVLTVAKPGKRQEWTTQARPASDFAIRVVSSFSNQKAHASRMPGQQKQQTSASDDLRDGWKHGEVWVNVRPESPPVRPNQDQ